MIKIVIYFILFIISVIGTYYSIYLTKSEKNEKNEKNKKKKHLRNAVVICCGTLAISILANMNIIDDIAEMKIFQNKEVSADMVSTDDDAGGNVEEQEEIIETEQTKNSYVLNSNDNITPSVQETSVDTHNIEDITEKSVLKGSIDVKNQKDQYIFKSKDKGIYRFFNELSDSGKVLIRISGEDNKTVDTGINELNVNLEADKTYILSIEYQDVLCEYITDINIPVAETDITGKTDVSGFIVNKDQKDEYVYAVSIDGIYRFDANLSSGGEVIIRISGENGKSLDYGINGLTVDLEAEKTYILSIEYRNGACEYTINIGVPIEMHDITGNTVISGNILYKDQKDKYIYTAPISGTYRFDTDLSSGGEVVVRISGENGNQIDYNWNCLTIDLEAGKTYILSIEYRSGVCDYIVNIGVPNLIKDITGTTGVSGNITYKDQKDKYIYVAPVNGTYYFNTNLSSGGSVLIRINGENGKMIDYGRNSMKQDFEAGKTYIISVEYYDGLCSYDLFVETS